MARRGRKLSRRESLRWLMMMFGAGVGLSACGKKYPNVSSNGVEMPTNTVPSVTDSEADSSAELLNTPQTTTIEKPTQTIEATEKQSVAQPTANQAYLSVARGEDPAAITTAALQALGGIERFVKTGYDVIIKPNICTDNYPFEYAATTNPQVVATLVRLALGAGAKRVRVMDFPFAGSPSSAYARSGIEEAVKTAGGVMEVMNPNKFRMTDIPQGQSIKEWEIFQDVLTCDLFIDVPIAKHHSLARVTLGAKNLLGVIQRRSNFHADMGQRIADLVSVIRPGLTVVDAVRVLMNHGPTGGNLDDVKLENTVIASHDIVAADTYAAGFFGLSGEDVPYIMKSVGMGLGTMDLNSVNIEEVSV